ncbi:hypothetical protein BGX21_001137 [Mortierella sp. AD011]|nr:hypothetical protein BGX21_001137 [Mortierella sp. AD011]
MSQLPLYNGTLDILPSDIAVTSFFKKTKICDWSLESFLRDTPFDTETFLEALHWVSSYKKLEESIRIFALQLRSHYSGTIGAKRVKIIKQKLECEINRTVISGQEHLINQGDLEKRLDRQISATSSSSSSSSSSFDQVASSPTPSALGIGSSFTRQVKHESDPLAGLDTSTAADDEGNIGEDIIASGVAASISIKPSRSRRKRARISYTTEEPWRSLISSLSKLIQGESNVTFPAALPCMSPKHTHLFEHAVDSLKKYQAQTVDRDATLLKDAQIVTGELAIEPYDRREASMVFNMDKFKRFPLNDVRDFESIRADPQYAYFDRTGYISILESLTGNGLDVDRDVKSGRVIPGQYLILPFDFSEVDRSRDLSVATKSLADMINGTVKQFYMTYAPYLGDKSSDQLIKENISPRAATSLRDCVISVQARLNNVMGKDDPLYGVKGIYLLADEYDAFINEFLNPDDPRPWDQLRTSPNSLLKGFWATVKGRLGRRSIVKCFITGVSPLSMADHTSGFNVATYVSWRKELSGLCGLTEEDVLAALRLPGVCKSEDEVQKHFEIMKTNYDGYNFAELGKALHVFNTNTCLEYLDSLTRGEPINPRAVSNSEVSEPALQILAASPIASSIISDSLSTPENHSIPYEELVQSFRLTHLASDIVVSKPAWLSYMLHIGGLTFDRGTKQLRIPNLIAAERFGKAVMDRAGLRHEDVSLAFKNIVSTGDIGQALQLYRQTMCIRDVGTSDFLKKEEHHRDSFYYTLLGNSHPSLRDIGLEAWTTKKKAEHLSGTFEVNDILDFKFNKHDKWRSGQTINDWILKDPLSSKDNEKGVSPARQLAQYVTSPEITQMKKGLEVTAYLVVVVGSRQILFWEMDDDGVFRKDPQLA